MDPFEARKVLNATEQKRYTGITERYNYLENKIAEAEAETAIQKQQIEKVSQVLLEQREQIRNAKVLEDMTQLDFIEQKFHYEYLARVKRLLEKEWKKVIKEKHEWFLFLPF